MFVTKNPTDNMRSYAMRGDVVNKTLVQLTQFSKGFNVSAVNPALRIPLSVRAHSAEADLCCYVLRTPTPQVKCALTTC